MSKTVKPELDRQALDRQLGAFLHEYLTDVGKEFVKEGKAIVSQRLQSHSGELLDGFGYKIIGTGADADVELYNDAKHARYQDEGTGKHGPKGRPIRPKKAKVLAFEINGEMVFAREVQGAPAIHFMDTASERAVDRTNRRYNV